MTRQMMFMLSPPELAWFFRQREAAEAGDGAAACRLGDCYRTGKPLPPANPRKAFRWYLRGAWAGDEDAMNNLGACYHNGYGCRKDMTQAIHWYQQAVEAGSAEALDNLGRCYLHGDGVPEDLERAADFFRKALAKGHPKAAERLTGMGLTVTVKEPDPAAEAKEDDPSKSPPWRWERRSGALGCPRCGCTKVEPGDYDSWYCGGCKQFYPTLAYRCHHPGCLEWMWEGDYCKEHQAPSPPQVDQQH